jgi:ketosteroid isomerase-like protein
LAHNVVMKPIYICITVLLRAATLAAQSKNTKVENEIRQVIETQSAAWNRGDIDGFMAGYWRSPELVFVSGDNVTRGWQQTLDRYKKSYNTREKMGTLVFSGLETFVLSKDAAVVLGNWSLTRAADNPHGKFTLTFRKMKEGWRIIMDHTS